MVKNMQKKMYINQQNDFNELSREFKLHVYGSETQNQSCKQESNKNQPTLNWSAELVFKYNCEQFHHILLQYWLLGF